MLINSIPYDRKTAIWITPMSITSGASEAIDFLIEAVEAADSANLLVTAMENLAATKQTAAVPTLIKALSYNNPGAAVAAVDGLIQIGEPAVAPILDQLDGHNYTARAWAIRALAGIGDPRGLVTLLGAATADFALSVRRAAAKGLGTMKWHWFPADLLEIAQEEALESLIFVAQQDEEWVVRYSAVVGLQALAGSIANYPDWQTQIKQVLAAVIEEDSIWAVRARALQAQQQLQAGLATETDLSEPAPNIDWQGILTNLYARKGEEREEIRAGDPRNYKDLAENIDRPSASSLDRSANRS
jgi:phycocyanobilin lyase subunit beta